MNKSLLHVCTCENMNYVLAIYKYKYQLTTNVFPFAHKRKFNHGKLSTHSMVTHHEVGEGSHNRDKEFDERMAAGTPPVLVETVRSLMVELQSSKDDNEMMMKEQEKQTEINIVLLQSLSDLQRQMQHEPET
jgi:hypothetical protein